MYIYKYIYTYITCGVHVNYDQVPIVVGCRMEHTWATWDDGIPDTAVGLYAIVLTGTQQKTLLTHSKFQALSSSLRI